MLKIVNTGIKVRLRKIIVFILKISGIRKFIQKIPTKYLTFEDWLKNKTKNVGDEIFIVENGIYISEKAPAILGHNISNRFTKYYNRKSPDVYVAKIQNGKVLGRDCNLIITADNILISDLSREFGATGGKETKDYKILTSQINIPKLTKLSGNIAVISTCGSSNFHHWLYDILPRIQILKKANLFDEIDCFLINYKGAPFQKESLEKIGFDFSKIINTSETTNCFFQATNLFIPSLTQKLTNITPWVVDHLRTIILTSNLEIGNTPQKIYVSRRNAPSRKIINESEFMSSLNCNGYEEFIPENFTLEEAALYFSKAKEIISVHGSGLSNLAFISKNTKVIDILAPYHQDPYYWMICNQRSAKYIGLFAEGDHPDDNLDLVKFGKDDDLYIDINKLEIALKL